MLKIIEPILKPSEIEYYKILVKSSEVFDLPSKSENYQNYYKRYNLNEKESTILLNKLKEKNYINSTYTVAALWINVVNSETNIDDDYHKDYSDRTLIIYLNDDFDGGEFEYYENDILKKIQPQKALSIVMDNKLLHRVTSVKKGVRYSLICFFKVNQKIKKSLL